MIAAASPPSSPDLNAPPPLENYNVFRTDRAAVDASARLCAADRIAELDALGARAGSAATIALGFAANENPPVLHTHDRVGRRIDEVQFHPAYHELLGGAVAAGLHSASWRRPGADAHVARALGFYVWSQVDAGHGCPVSMTHAAVPLLRVQPELAAVWEPLILGTTYDPVLAPAHSKRGALLGMGMTEKHGGSDVRANVTRAVPMTRGGPGEPYAITGHKWFCSAPMSDAFAILAQAPGGIACFLLPRVLPDGTRNAFAIQRLKDKVGNRSNASSEVEWDGATAWLIGEEGRGIHAIVEMVNFTRLDCIIGSAAGMRQALAQAAHHMRYRRTFGKPLVEHALARNVLADLALESEAALLTFVRIAHACDNAADAHEAGIKRIATALGKYWVCKRAPAFTAEALEALGGNGYVEESIMPRLFRESPLNGLWEGAGSVNALDVVRIMAKDARAVNALRDELALARGCNRDYDAALHALDAQLADPTDIEWRARRIVEDSALAFCASLMLRFGAPAAAELFCRSRLAGDWGRTFGTLPRGAGIDALIERATPVVDG